MEERGAINAYRCEACQKRHVTINLNAGTTPFMTSCPECGAMAQSSFYHIADAVLEGDQGKLTASHAWYRPCMDEYASLDTQSQAHVAMGGLIKGKLGEAFPLPDKVTPDISFEDMIKLAHDEYAIDSEVEEALQWRLAIAAEDDSEHKGKKK